MALDPRFLREFGASFEADVIQIKDADLLETEARGLAGDLTRSQIDITELKRHLAEFLRNWDQTTMDELKRATSVDWQFNQETEGALKRIITAILKELNAS